jgi:signal transduction histidine kinase
MSPRSARRTALVALAAVALLGALAFLFARTQATGYKGDLNAMSLMRELRDMDARWDMDGLRLANDLSDTPENLADRTGFISRILQELSQGSAAAQVPQLRDGIEQKQRAFARLREAHAASRAAGRAAREALTALTTEAGALRAREPRAADRAATLATQAELLRAGLRSGDIEFHQDIARSMEPRLALLLAAAGSDNAALASARRAEGAVREYLARRAAEADAWRKFAFMTVGARVDMLARSLSKSVESALDDKDRWRVYLVAYAAALLLGVGHLGLRVASTQAQLRDANEQLERRVAERTRDLETALRQLKESEAQLVQSEKMSSLGQLVAGVAHEINTPLAYVKNSMALVRERLPAMRAVLGPDESLDELEALARDGLHGIDQIQELVANLRNFSRLDRSKVASFNVNEGLRATLLIARPTLRKVDVEQHLEDIPSITCSPSQVNQVILNLLTNAAQAIDKPRGRIVLSTRREGADRVAIEVADNGRGIPPENMPRIFDPFFTTKEVGKGTGLGLTIAYKIVSQHGGRIDVRSEPGVGSTFTVVLPIDAPAGAAGEAKREEAVA